MSNAFTASEDFIGFGDLEEPTQPRASTSKGAASAASGGRKRKLAAVDFDGARATPDKERVLQPWAADVRWDACRTAADMLHSEVAAFHRYVSPTPTEQALRESVVESMRRAIRDRWDEADVRAFGSFATGLYLPHGDIDLVVTYPTLMEQMGGPFQGGKSDPWAKTIVRRLNQIAALLRVRDLARDVIVISHARVPIVKFTSRVGSYPMDISVNMTNGLRAIATIERLFSDVGTEAARALVVTVKAFLHQRGLNEVFSGGLGSYAIVCLVVSFLQLHPGIQGGHFDPSANLGTLLVEFFELYGKNFNFDDVGVRLKNGGGYYSKATRGFMNPTDTFQLSIEDPADVSNDIASGTYNLYNIRQSFSGAYDLLTTALHERIRQINASPHQRDRLTRRSLLACVLSASAEDVHKRTTYAKQAEALGLVVSRAPSPVPAPMPTKPAEQVRKEAREAAKALAQPERDAAKAQRKEARKAAKRERKKAKKEAEKQAAAEAAATNVVEAVSSVESAADGAESDEPTPKRRALNGTNGSPIKAKPSAAQLLAAESSESDQDDLIIGQDSASDDDSRYLVHLAARSDAPTPSTTRQVPTTPASFADNLDFIGLDDDSEDSDAPAPAPLPRVKPLRSPEKSKRKRDFWASKGPRAPPSADVEDGELPY